MSTFNLSLNQKFLLTTKEEPCSIICASYNNINIQKLISVCEFVISNIPVLQYQLIDVSAKFPIQGETNKKTQIKICDINNFDFKDFSSYDELEWLDNHNSYSENPVKIQIIKSSRIYLILSISGYFADNYSLQWLLNKISLNLSGSDLEINQEFQYVDFAQWQQELVDEAKNEKNSYWQKKAESKYNGALINLFDKVNAVDNSIGFYFPKTTNFVISKPTLQSRFNYSDSNIVSALLIGFLKQYHTGEEIAVGYLPYNRNYDELLTTVGLINVPLPIISPEFNYNDDYFFEVSGLIKDQLENRDNFDYTIFSEKYTQAVVEHINFDTINDNKFDFKLESYANLNTQTKLRLILIENKGNYVIQPIFQSNEINFEIAELVTLQLKRYLSNILNFKHSVESTKEEFDFSIGIKHIENNYLFNLKSQSNNFSDILKELFIIHGKNDFLVCGTEIFTYYEIDVLSDLLAQFLKSNSNLKSNSLVGLHLDRSHWQIIALIAIIKNGCGYIPLDINLPKNRLSLILEDSDCKVIINQDLINSFILEKNNFEYKGVFEPVNENSPFNRLFSSNKSSKVDF